MIRWSATQGGDVLSNSWGWFEPVPFLQSAYVDVTKAGGIGRQGKGCVVVFGAGNQGGPIYFGDPAGYPEVIAVGATDNRDERWAYSAYGPELDIVAPGGYGFEINSIWTTDITGPAGASSDPENPFPEIQDYSLFNGTSSACPVVAGVAALILSLEPGLTSGQVRHFLERSAKDLGDPGRDDYYGWGRVDARAALDMVLAKRCDLNDDWRVDYRDFALLAQNWQKEDASADIAPATGRDGYVGLEDVVLMYQYWLYEIPEL
jgi:subtilisin family serine protease